MTSLLAALAPMTTILADQLAKAPARVYMGVVIVVALLFAGMIIGLSFWSSRRDHRD